MHYSHLFLILLFLILWKCLCKAGEAVWLRELTPNPSHLVLSCLTASLQITLLGAVGGHRSRGLVAGGVAGFAMASAEPFFVTAIADFLAPRSKAAPWGLCHLLPGALGPCELPPLLAPDGSGWAEGSPAACSSELNPASAGKYFEQGCTFPVSPLLVPVRRGGTSVAGTWSQHHC